ncbi:MAG: ATP-binding protein [Capnocytophaga sp.]|nr:ATP-binding protein [Capnocytophaga sp.]
MELQETFKQQVRDALMSARENYGGSDAAFAKSAGINGSVFSRLKNGETEKLLSDGEYIRLAMRFGVNPNIVQWKTARTQVYNDIERDLNFCKKHGKSMILIDMPGVGKTYCSQRILKEMRNGFYFDCSQAKTRQQFIRNLAETVGAGGNGRFNDVKNRLKYTLNVLEKPIIVLDDSGYLDNPAFLEVQELWNGTEGRCAWYMIGDNALQTKIERGIQRDRIGYKAIFSRFSEEYVNLLPVGKDDKQEYLKQLIGDVASANLEDTAIVHKIIKKCIAQGKTLRNVDTIIRTIQDEIA